MTLFTALCSFIVNKEFLLFLILSALPPSTFCLWKPWFVVRSLPLEPGWPASSPASKPVADEKFMTLCLENLTFHLMCCCPSDAAPTDGDCICRLHSTSAFPHSGSANQGERGGTVSTTISSFIGIHSSETDFCCLCAIIKHWCF